MADTAKRFIGPVSMPSSWTTFYTVPTGVTAVMRYLRVANSSGGDLQFVLSLGPDAVGSRIFDQWVPGPGGVLEWTGFIPLNPAETLVGVAPGINMLTLIAAGVEVT